MGPKVGRKDNEVYCTYSQGSKAFYQPSIPHQKQPKGGILHLHKTLYKNNIFALEIKYLIEKYHILLLEGIFLTGLRVLQSCMATKSTDMLPDCYRALIVGL